DRIFAAQNTDRAWLRADQLFQRSSRGAEELTSQGISTLNSALASYGDRILESPIIVEGYCDSDNAADRLTVSHHRATLVRNYLRTHFALNTDRVGAVALEDRPPDGSARTSWNGVVVVLLKVKR